MRTDSCLVKISGKDIPPSSSACTRSISEGNDCKGNSPVGWAGGCVLFRLCMGCSEGADGCEMTNFLQRPFRPFRTVRNSSARFGCSSSLLCVIVQFTASAYSDSVSCGLLRIHSTLRFMSSRRSGGGTATFLTALYSRFICFSLNLWKTPPRWS